MPGFPITIVATGGIAVTQVDSGAPVASVSTQGIAVTLVGSGGLPLVIEGIQPDAQSLFTEAQLTGLTNAGDNSGYNLGFKVIPAVDGWFGAVYFGKPAGAVQTVRLAGVYSTAGTLLMSGSRGEMTPEPAAGERVAVSLSEPLEVTAGTTYVAQVTVNAGGTGGYAVQAGGFATAVVNGDLTAPSDAESGGNGVFNDSSGVALAFASTDGSANYWVDVMFTPGALPSLPAGYPNASNTGHSGTLSTYAGPMTITVDDTVIENQHITGQLTVEASNVIIRNCFVEYAGDWGIYAELGPNITIQDCTITGPGVGGTANSGINGAGLIERNKISQSENGISCGAGAGIVRDNYIFDLRSSAAIPHYDGIALQGGQNGHLVEHNTIVSSDTSCIFLKDDFGAITDVTINDNLCLADDTLGAPGYMIVIDQVTSITSITVTNNLLTRGSFGYYSADISATVSGNVNAYTGIPI